jgi:hypothetical protein
MKTGAHSGRTYGKVQPVYASEAALSSIQTPRLPDRPARVQVRHHVIAGAVRQCSL